MYTHTYRIQMADTDAAQRLYFGNQFSIAHSAFEEFMASIGHPFEKLLGEHDFLLPVVKAEAEYHHPLSPGQVLRIELRLGHIGRTSLSFNYNLFIDDHVLAGEVKTTHVHINKKTGKPERLSRGLLEALKPLEE